MGISGQYIALCADERINCDSSGKLYIAKEDIICEDTQVLMSINDDVNNIKAEFSQPVLDSEMKNATMTATLYTGGGDGRTVMSTVSARGIVSERTAFVSTIPVAEVNMASDMAMCVIFGMLTFVAVMICDILIGKRI